MSASMAQRHEGALSKKEGRAKLGTVVVWKSYHFRLDGRKLAYYVDAVSMKGRPHRPVLAEYEVVGVDELAHKQSRGSLSLAGKMHRFDVLFRDGGDPDAAATLALALHAPDADARSSWLDALHTVLPAGTAVAATAAAADEREETLEGVIAGAEALEEGAASAAEAIDGSVLEEQDGATEQTTATEQVLSDLGQNLADILGVEPDALLQAAEVLEGALKKLGTLGTCVRVLTTVYRAHRTAKHMGAHCAAFLEYLKTVVEQLSSMRGAFKEQRGFEELGRVLDSAATLLKECVERGTVMRTVKALSDKSSLAAKKAEIESAMRLPMLAMAHQTQQTLQELAAQAATAAPALEDVPTSNLPFGRNVAFKGREEELAQLRATLNLPAGGGGDASAGAGAVAAVCSVSSMGGMGKTQVALELAFRLLAEGGVQRVMWVDAEGATLPGNFARAGEAMLPLPAVDGLSDDDRAKRVTQALEGHDERWLLVLDNVDERSAFRRFLPKTGRCHTLITTRCRGLPNVKEVELGTLSDKAALALLCGKERYGAADVASLREVVAQLGQLTIALATAARLLRLGRHTPDSLRALLRSDGALAWSDEAHARGDTDEVFHAPTSLRVLFTSSLDMLREDAECDRLARRVVAVLGFCGPESVPLPLLRACLATGGEDGQAAADGAAGGGEGGGSSGAGDAVAQRVAALTAFYA